MYSIKLIGAGLVLNRNRTLEEQGIKNNQQIMAVVLNERNSEENIYDKVQEIKDDTNLLLMDANAQHMQVNKMLFRS